MKRLLTLLMITVFAITLTGCGGGDSSSSSSGGVSETQQKSEAAKVTTDDSKSKKSTKSDNVNGDLTIKMLNVGQGDAILIQTKTQNVLIDTSDADEWEKVQRELSKAGVKKIDKLILTHPHADHIGNARTIIEQYNVDEVYDNGTDSNSPFYRSKSKSKKNSKGYVDYIEDNPKVKLIHLKDGDKSLNFGGNVKFNVFYPTDSAIEASKERGFNINNGSIVGKLTYKNFSMLFTGDAEKEVESDILASHKSELKSTVLKAPHHGSKSSSTKNYLAAVKPKYVVISAGEPDIKGGNTYGHPHDVALNNYRNSDVDDNNIYWTYKNGTITITTDGKTDDCHIEVENNERWLAEWLTSKANRKK